MFYVSNFDNNRAIKVTDTSDNSVETYDLKTLVDMNNAGTAIIGIDSNGIWRDYNPEKALFEFYTGELISSETLCDTLMALNFSSEYGYKTIGTTSSSASHNINKLMSSDSAVCDAKVVRPNLPGVLTGRDFSCRRIRREFNASDILYLPYIFPYAWTNMKVYDFDDAASTVVTGISMDNEVSYLDKGYQYGRTMLMPLGYTDLALLSKYLPEFTMSYLNANTDSEYDRSNEDVIKFYKPAGEVKKLDTIDYGDTTAFMVDDHIFLIDAFSDNTNKFILSHHIIEKTGEIVFLVLGNTILYADSSNLGDLPYGGDALRLVSLESLLLGSNVENNKYVISKDDYTNVSAMFMNADFNGNEVIYKGLHGTFRIDLNKYRSMKSPCADINIVKRVDAADRLLKRIHGNHGIRGTAISAYPLRTDTSFDEDVENVPDYPSVLEITDGVKYLSWNFVFEPYSMSIGYAIDDDMKNLKQLREIIFPKGFIDVLDYTCVLEEIFKYITSGKDFEPVKLTFKGDYISDFFKPFMK